MLKSYNSNELKIKELSMYFQMYYNIVIRCFNPTGVNKSYLLFNENDERKNQEAVDTVE